MKAPTDRRRPGKPRGANAAETAARPAHAPQTAPALRMRDLVRESGLPRETIHFYMQQGLLPKALKTGRNTALYTQEHLERLRRIRELQERQFLPLKAIRAILDDTADEGFTPEQEDLVRRVRATLADIRNAINGGLDTTLAEGLALEGRLSKAATQRMDRARFAATREAVMSRGKEQSS